jgi:hypothetical protein
MDAHRAKDVQDVKNQLYQLDFDIIICASLGVSNYLDILKIVRYEQHWTKNKTKIICLEQNWTNAVAGQLRDFGVTLRGTLPFSLSGLLKMLTLCFNDSRTFILIQNFRGPDRRSPKPTEYSGPRRRSADAENSVEAKEITQKSPENRLPSTNRPEPVKLSQRAKLAAEPEKNKELGFGLPPEAEKSEQYHDSALLQTKVVIDNAFNIIGEIATLSATLRSLKASKNRPDLLHKIAEASERLVNLLSLACERIEVHGCNEYLLGRLGEIKASIALNTEELAEAAARRAIDYGTAILAKSHGIPLGAGEFIAQQVGRMEALIQAIGGTDKLSEIMRSLVLEANNILGEIFAREKKTVSKLSNID